MSTRTLNADNFESTIAAGGIVFVDFWAAWCGPCRQFAPVFQAASTKHEDIVFGKVDTEAQPALAGAFQISSIPTLMVIRDKVVLYAQPGALPAPALEEIISKTREIDMDDVRRQLEQQGAKS